jgi:hypothetical protein
MALSKTTRDHEEIRRWAVARGAKPAAVSSTERNDQTGILRLEFPGKPNAKDSALEEISWDEWFEKFDASGLELTFQEKTVSGERSNFNKLTYPQNARPSSRSTRGRSADQSGSTAKASRAHSRSMEEGREEGRAAESRTGRGSSNKATGRGSSARRATAKRSSSRTSQAGNTRSSASSHGVAKKASARASASRSGGSRSASGTRSSSSRTSGHKTSARGRSRD